MRKVNGVNTGSNGDEHVRLGAKVKALRRREGLSQVQLSERIGISPSYLNLIENDKRPLPASLLLRLVQLFNVDLATFGQDDQPQLVSDMLEALSDPLFESHGLNSADVRELAVSQPSLARAMLTLYRAFQDEKETAESLAMRLSELEGEAEGRTSVDRFRAPSEEVNDLVQAHMNYFPVLESAAEKLWDTAALDPNDLYLRLVRYLEQRHNIHVRIARWGEERGTLRRYDSQARLVTLSELLPTRSRNFQIAHQIGLLEQSQAIEAIIQDKHLTSDDARTLARVALGNYYAGAVLMPYSAFLTAAREERYDIDVIGRRFRVGFEQVCHRLTTLRRPSAEGVPFHMIRIDVAGNISKRFSASGIRFARFSGACPRWNVFAAFLTPGLIRIQLSRMYDGSSYFCIARTIQKDAGGYHTQHPVQAIGLGCRTEYAKELVYSDGVDLENPHAVVPVGVTCRMCERADCEQRALPSIRMPLRINENVRRASLYAPSVTK